MPPFWPQKHLVFANRVKTSLVLSHSYGWNLLSPVSFTGTADRRRWIKARAVKKTPSEVLKTQGNHLTTASGVICDGQVSYGCTLSPFSSADVAQFKGSSPTKALDWHFTDNTKPQGFRGCFSSFLWVGIWETLACLSISRLHLGTEPIWRTLQSPIGLQIHLQILTVTWEWM